jgi:hypothetical protein
MAHALSESPANPDSIHDLGSNPAIEEAYVGRTDILGDVPFDESLVRGQLQDTMPNFSDMESQSSQFEQSS